MRKKSYMIDTDRVTERFNDPSGKIMLGVDGYIDEVWQIVESRTDWTNYRLYEKMSDFSGTLVKCPGGGFSNEIVRKRRTYGGFTANTGKAISRLGVKTAMLGMFGQGSIDPAFADFTEATELTSIGDPAICQIYEFADGKLMFPYVEDIMSFDRDVLINAIGEPGLKTMFDDVDIIAFGYWSLQPAFDEVVDYFCSLARRSGKEKRMFFDLADIRKRDRQSLEKTLCKLSGLNDDVPMTLSLNEHEAELLFSYYGEAFSYTDAFSRQAEGVDAQTERVRRSIGLDELVVHTPYFASGASCSEGDCTIMQNHCKSPVITTGAGDNFNGGYMSAALKGLTLPERLAVGNAVTYLYVSQGYCPTKDEMLTALASGGAQ